MNWCIAFFTFAGAVHVGVQVVEDWRRVTPRVEAAARSALTSGSIGACGAERPIRAFSIRHDRPG